MGAGQAGVYAIFLRDGKRLLADAGFGGDPARHAWTVNGAFRHVYTGQGYSLRTRLTEHVQGSAFGSNLRHTLLAINRVTEFLSPPISDLTTQEDVEEALSAWIKENVLIGFKVCHYVREAEAAVLRLGESALNIADREAAPFSKLLLNLRARFKEAAMGTWTRPANQFSGKRRPRG